jgi:hypothetical protein
MGVTQGCFSVRLFFIVSSVIFIWLIPFFVDCNKGAAGAFYTFVTSGVS